MYGYYLLSAMGVKQVVFIKRYITQMQLTQFCMMLALSIKNISSDWEKQPGESYPLELSISLFFYMHTMLALFGNFYIQAYRQKAKQQKQKLL